MFKKIKKKAIEKVSDEIKDRTEEIAGSLTDKISDISETVQSKTDLFSKSVGDIFERDKEGENIVIDVEVEDNYSEPSQSDDWMGTIDDFGAPIEDESFRAQQSSAEKSFDILESRRKKKKKRSIAAIIAGFVLAGSAVGGISQHAEQVAMAESYDRAVSYVVAEEYDKALTELDELTIDDSEAISKYAYIQSNIEDYEGRPESMLEAIQDIDSIENTDVKRQQDLACEDLELADEIQDEIDGLDLSSVKSISKGEVAEIQTQTNKLDDRYKILLSTDKYDLAARVLNNVETKNDAGQLIVAIDNLGDITLDSGTEIENLQTAYNNLSSSDKETILNYSILTAASNTYAALKAADEERKAAEKKAEEERLAAEKKAEEERRAAEEQAEQERLAAAEREAESSGEMVWIPRTGSKYHRSSTCSNMKNPTQVTREQAESWGYDPCKKCY